MNELWHKLNYVVWNYSSVFTMTYGGAYLMAVVSVSVELQHSLGLWYIDW